LELFGGTTFYRYQQQFLFPAIDIQWQKEKAEVFEDLRNFNDGKMILAGDGQCDSPGYSAKYCVYTFLSTQLNKVVHFHVASVTDTTSSVAMEKCGFKIALDHLLESQLAIEIIATDRHMGIAKLMREEYEDIIHEYDVWHFAKSVKKKLLAKGKKKEGEDLVPWIQSTGNHLWWASKTCGGDAELLKEKWTSIVHHTVGVHEWSAFKKFHECAHPELSEEESGRKQWLVPGSASHEGLKKVVFDKRTLNDMNHLVHFCHTGSLESFHNLATKYRPKRQHFGLDGMEARTKLTALAHNANSGTMRTVGGSRLL
jgi:hypothetical protein